MTPFDGLETRPSRRPVSPFVLLLLGGAATALCTEWLRFQGTPALAIVPAALGSVVTIASVARAYRARRRWRRVNERRSADVLAGHPAAEPASLLTIREEDGRLAIVRAVAHDEPPSPLLARPADERGAELPRSGPFADRAHRASRGEVSVDGAEADAETEERQSSHAERESTANR